MGNDLIQYRAAIGRFHAARKNKTIWTPFDIALFYAFINGRNLRTDNDNEDEDDNENKETIYNHDNEKIDTVISSIINKEKKGWCMRVHDFDSYFCAKDSS